MVYEVIDRYGNTMLSTEDFSEAFAFFMDREDCGAYAILEDGKPIGW